MRLPASSPAQRSRWVSSPRSVSRGPCRSISRLRLAATDRTRAGSPGRGRPCAAPGAQSADFYLRTGRMPLADPTDEPLRSTPAYSEGARSGALVSVHRVARRAGDPAREPGEREHRRGPGGVHRALRRLPPDRRQGRRRHRRGGAAARCRDADPARRGGAGRPLPDAALRPAARSTSRRSTRSPATCRLSAASARSRRLGDRPHRPDPGGDGRLAAGRLAAARRRPPHRRASAVMSGLMARLAALRGVARGLAGAEPLIDGGRGGPAIRRVACCPIRLVGNWRSRGCSPPPGSPGPASSSRSCSTPHTQLLGVTLGGALALLSRRRS